MEEVKKESANLIAKKAVVQEIIEKIKSSKSVVLRKFPSFVTNANRQAVSTRFIKTLS